MVPIPSTVPVVSTLVRFPHILHRTDQETDGMKATTLLGAPRSQPSHYASSGFAPQSTPSSYAYDPTAIPSRPASMSSSASGSDSPPTTPIGRFSKVAGKTFASFKRFSTHNTPVVGKDTYSPSVSASSVHSRDSSAGPTTPTSVSRVRYLDYSTSSGPPSQVELGAALTDDGLAPSWGSKNSMLFGEPLPVDAPKNLPQLTNKGRRKPVPRYVEHELMDPVTT